MTVTPPFADRTPGRKLLVVLLLVAMLTVPLVAVYLLVWDRETQSGTARQSIVAGWGAPQKLAGPVLVIPYMAQTSEAVTENGHTVQRVSTVERELSIAPDVADLTTRILPEQRRRSIYSAVVYAADTAGEVRFTLPPDLQRLGVVPERLAFDRAELRFGLGDARGLVGTPPTVLVAGRRIALRPGHGPVETDGAGFFAALDAGSLRTGPLPVSFRFAFRGSASLMLVPQAGDTRWHVTSPWTSPGFAGGFLPTERRLDARGFDAVWRVGNLALGRPLVDTHLANPATATPDATRAGGYEAQVDLVSPVDIYAQVDRSVKYGFLFIGFTFAAFLLFDVIGGVRVATPEYLLVGMGLILFFVLLLAFAEVIGFTPAYLLASAAIIGLLATYSAAVLGGRQRGGAVAGLLGILYGVLYVLLSLEAFSLLIGSVLLFASLAGVMYVTRRLDWSGGEVC